MISLKSYQKVLTDSYQKFGRLAWVSLSILVGTGLLTYTYVMFNQSLVDTVYQYINSAMPEVRPGDSLLWIILGRNTMAAAIFILMGLFSLGLGTLAALSVNGALIGGLMAFSQVKGQVIWKLFVIGILPHGILEIPAIALAGGTGLTLAQVLIRRGMGNREESVKDSLKAAGLCYLLVIAPALLLAAIIESAITPLLINKFLV